MNRSKIILLIIAGICTLVLATMLLLHSWLPAYLSDKIEDSIRTGLNPESIELYEVVAGTSSISALFQHARIAEIRIIPMDIADNEIDASLYPSQIIAADIYNLKISSWALISMAMGWKTVNVNHLSADSIFLVIYSNDSGTMKADTAQRMNLEHLHFKNLSTQKLSIEKRSVADTSGLVFQTGNIDFIGDISFYGKDQDHFMNPRIVAHSLKIWGADSYASRGLHSFHAESIFIDGQQQTADLNGLKMTPRYSKQEFSRHIQFEEGRFDVSLDNIKIYGFQQNRVMEDGAIVISHIEVNGGRLEAFRDRNPPFNENQRPPPPVSLLQDAPFGLFVNEIQLNEIDIVYEERSEGADVNTTGKIPFQQLSATINNFTNLKDSLASDSIMHIRAGALMFGKAMLQAEFKYTLTSPYGAYEAKAELATLRFVDINSAVYPLAGIKAIDGIHQLSSLYFYGNDRRSVGELRMRYTDLEIELIPDSRKVFKDIARFVGRNVVYFQNNPEENDELRVGKIEYDRDVTRFVFHYWWHCYLSGIKNTMLKDLFSG